LPAIAKVARLAAVLFVTSCASGEAPLITQAPGDAPPGMVWIPGGRFDMGSESAFAGPEERPVHTVEVDGFYMDVHSVTNARFRAFIEATGYVTVAERAPDEESIMRQLPPAHRGHLLDRSCLGPWCSRQRPHP
jgi:formylglycine-generating enzyme required for sulfatase activity